MNLLSQLTTYARPPSPAPWTHQFSNTGTFDGLLSNDAYMQEKLYPQAPKAPADVAPCDKWGPYLVPILDQRVTGMCQSFSSMIALSILLRAKLNPLMLAGDVDTIEDDLCFDPRVGHKLGRSRYAPGVPYSSKEGLSAGTTITVLSEEDYLSPGTSSDVIEWDDVPRAMHDGPVEFPELVHDGYDPANMIPHTYEIPTPKNNLSVRGGHSMCGAMSFRAKDGNWGVMLVNSWNPEQWGQQGFASIMLWHAKWAALDRPRVLRIRDIEWYVENDKWRELLCLKTELDAWLKQQ